MSFCIKNLTAKNFLSVGNATQAVQFDRHDLTLVLGENLDLGGDDKSARNGTGKSQPLTSNVLTPIGWRKMGDLSVGDEIITADGITSNITGVFPQGKIETYKITFKDGRTCEASGDHLWKVYSHWFTLKSDSDKERILTTKELILLLKKAKSRPGNKSSSYLYVPLIKPAIIDDIKLPMDPWLLGFMISDGSFSKSAQGRRFTSADDFLIQKANDIVNRDYNCHVISSGIECSFKMNIRSRPHPIRIAFNNLGLNGCLSYTKFIPEIYKNASIEQKLSLLRGLIDSDGTVDRRTGSVTFTSVSKQLANDVAYIIRSIGGLASISAKTNCTYKYKDEIRRDADSYTVSIRYSTPGNLISLPRKKLLTKENYQYANQLRLQITNIEQIHDQECQCIAINHPSHLYVTDNFITTHNTSIINALSYAFYGTALSNIKKDNLINKTNTKGMLVTVEFEKNGTSYRIERGRKPGILSFYKGDIAYKSEDNDAQGDSRETQNEINKLLGMSHEMFRHIVALNTYTEPFLGLGANDQRNIIEQLLGITQLSEKAELLKEQIKLSKDLITSEEYRITAIIGANKKIEEQVESLKRRQQIWQNKHAEEITKLQESLDKLAMINIDEEINKHKLLVEYHQKKKDITAVSAEIERSNQDLVREEKGVKKLLPEIQSLENHTCHACGQEIHNQTQEQLLESKKELLKEHSDKIFELAEYIKQLTVGLESLSGLGPVPVTAYKTSEEALHHRTTVKHQQEQLDYKLAAENPYSEQITEMETTALTEINYSIINDTAKLKEHQEFLLKLLTNKDSFVRKRIIDQNLTYLNARLSYYLAKIGLPHTVVFQNDLGVTIEELGRDLDFYNLSRGEMTRLILSLSLSFRDVWESLYEPINLLFIDEIIDNGLDTIGVENAMAILKRMARDNQKSIWLISHKDELTSRVSNILHVKKSNGFTEWNDSDSDSEE